MRAPRFFLRTVGTVAQPLVELVDTVRGGVITSAGDEPGIEDLRTMCFYFNDLHEGEVGND
jgi:hypothetical protein